MKPIIISKPVPVTMGNGKILFAYVEMLRYEPTPIDAHVRLIQRSLESPLVIPTRKPRKRRQYLTKQQHKLYRAVRHVHGSIFGFDVVKRAISMDHPHPIPKRKVKVKKNDNSR